jgi:HEAT repeat protein
MDEVEKRIMELEDPSWSVRYDAAGKLGELKDPRAVPGLARALKDEYFRVRYPAVWALGNVASANPGDQCVMEAVSALIGALKDMIRHRIVSDALVQIGVPAVPALLEVLHDEEGDMRTIATWALGKIAAGNLDRAGDVVPVLFGGLNDKDFFVRKSVPDALGTVLDACSDAASLGEFERRFAEGARALRASQKRGRDAGAMQDLARLANRIAIKRNELSRAGTDGLLLDEIPKAPKKDKVYQEMRRVRNG